MKADLNLIDNYDFSSNEPVGCNISVFGSRDDPLTSDRGLTLWRDYTKKDYSIDIDFSGGHFFFKKHEEEILNLICNKLNNRLI